MKRPGYVQRRAGDDADCFEPGIRIVTRDRVAGREGEGVESSAGSQLTEEARLRLRDT